ncbi:MAG: Crp/Fnr family transcriptional regulator [Burkholderiaceae bacterium]|nr:Crp/Fnr family transcriptional regulator [Burkholderiaceae bacterium]
MRPMIFPETLKALLPSDVQSLCDAALIKKNERVFLAGTIPFWMYYVISGEVTLERSGLHGESVVLQRTRQGFVSEASLKVSRYHCDAIAITDTHVIKVPVKALACALDEDLAFAGRWINMLNAEVRRLRLHLERLSMKSIRERLIHLIETEGEGGQFATPSGLKTLAGELGITHEALYRTISRLESDKVLRRDANQMVLIRSSAVGSS